MSEIKNIITLHNNKENLKVYKRAECSFLLFEESYLEITKTVDRPNDYYFRGEKIAFEIKIKNIGNANLRNFTIRDNSIKDLAPLESGYYDIIAPQGEISLFDDYVQIDNITLLKGEELTITVSGIIKEEDTIEDFSDDDFSFKEENSEFSE